ncbi:DegT/DnrJ/EryC1/StrS family aminotransferase [Halorientalis litorea]|uniref:DegT/DnrJ/EryC1/StrS family aminotransferase n=1 Tax=Halorientalis litorea TaxID=2931977 RepID=UPI001FF6451F|nr:DegT/DnrJ/EryC1/StrS family aminotransferase [Halorientalis litorea]
MTGSNELGQVELGTPVVGEDELDAIADVFETGWVLNGPTTREFEDEFAEYVGAEHAVSVVNCTAGMDMALNALDLPEDATVIVPGQAFIANGIAIGQNGFEPLFVDVDPETYNITADAIAERGAEADAVLLIHHGGYPCDMDAIMDVADEYDLRVVEDAAHALGSEYEGEKIGVHGDATVFSFGPLKMITTGMGGMVTTPHEDVADNVETLRSYGMDTDAWNREEDPKPWQYSIPQLGHNYRLSDVASGMGLAQLEKVEDFIAHRRQRAAEYTAAFDDVDGIETPPVTDNRRHTYLYYVVRVTDEYPLSRDELAHKLMDADVGISVHWDPALHHHQLFDEQGPTPTLPVSEQLADELLTLPMHPRLTKAEAEHVIELIDTETDK